MIFTHEPSFLCFLHHSQGSLGFEKTHCTLVGLRGEDVQSDDGSDMGHIGASLSFRICCCRGIAWGACVRVVFGDVVIQQILSVRLHLGLISAFTVVFA